jgi:N-methylhydantoinase B
VAPIHRERRLIGYAVNRAHHADVGGSAPGSMPAGATDIFQEGLRIPPVRTWRAGVEQRDVIALLLANSRTPDERVGDLRAQAAANHLMTERTLELEARLGGDRLRASMRATQDHAERSMRAAILRIPDGAYAAIDVMDGDGITDADLPIRVLVTVEGDRVTADFEGTSPQARGSVNAPFAVTVSACSYVLRAVTDPGIPANAGAHRPLTVLAPAGSMLNPLPPAAVAAGNVETSQRIVDVLLRALAPALPDRVPVLLLRDARRRAGSTARARRHERGAHPYDEHPQHPGRGAGGSVPAADRGVSPARRDRRGGTVAGRRRPPAFVPDPR